MMKKLLCLVLVLALFSGCSGVWMNATYSALLDRTAALSSETATQAEAGKMAPDEMKAALRSQANVWLQFRNARDGVAK